MYQNDRKITKKISIWSKKKKFNFFQKHFW